MNIQPSPLKSALEWLLALLLLTPMLTFNLWWAGVALPKIGGHLVITTAASSIVLAGLCAKGRPFTGLCLSGVTALTVYYPSALSLSLLVVSLTAAFTLRRPGTV